MQPPDRLDDLSPARQTARPPAGFLRRSLAALIDGLIVLAFLLFEAYVLVGPLGLPVSRETPGATDLVYFLAGILFCWLYCAAGESSRRGQTLGKRCVGLAVETPGGDRPGFGRASLRFVARFATIATALLGWLLILLTRRRQALHDLLAGTMVVVASPKTLPA